jgi:hypothetical protein
MSFSSDITKFVKKTEDRFIRIKKASAFDLFSAIIIQTPVLTGTLRNNWYMSFNTPSTEASENPSNSIERVNFSLKDIDAFNSVYFVNNLPYAVPIEYDGLSGKAPEGMFRVNVARWPSIVEKNAARL